MHTPDGPRISYEPVDTSLITPRPRKYEREVSLPSMPPHDPPQGHAPGHAGVVSRTGSLSRSPTGRARTCISVLMEIAKDPVTAEGKQTSPVVWDRACLEEVCGSCAMSINGVRRMACTALIDALDSPDRARADREVPGRARPLRRPRSHVRGVEAREGVDPDRRHLRPRSRPAHGGVGARPGLRAVEAASPAAAASRCARRCNDRSSFIGAAAIGQAALFNLHPTGRMLAKTSVSTRSWATAASTTAATPRTACGCVRSRSR